jgi:hypothetical protein
MTICIEVADSVSIKLACGPMSAPLQTTMSQATANGTDCQSSTTKTARRRLMQARRRTSARTFDLHVAINLTAVPTNQCNCSTRANVRS